MSGKAWNEPDDDEVEDTGSFADEMDVEHEDNTAPEEYQGKFSGNPDQIQAPELKTLVSTKIRISHGVHGEDYVWHIAPADPRFQFKVAPMDVMKAVAGTMNQVIPESIEVKIWPPLADWDIQDYTFKAMELVSCWQIQPKDIDAINKKLFEVLNTLV